MAAHIAAEVGERGVVARLLARHVVGWKAKDGEAV